MACVGAMHMMNLVGQTTASCRHECGSRICPLRCTFVSFWLRIKALAAYMQDELKGSDAHWNWLTPRPGGASMPFAWDEPLAPHKLRVHVSCW